MIAGAAGPVALLVAAAVALAACATIPVVGGDGLTFDARRERLEAVDQWEMRGRLAIDTPDQGGRQARFEWRQRGRELTLAVRGPIGIGGLRVTGTPESLLVTARGETWSLGDPEQELSAMLGWWLPVASLEHWLLGLPDPAFGGEAEPGLAGALESLEQRLWRLDYVTYQLVEGVLIPRRIDLAHAQLTLRITVDSWRAAAPQTAS